MSKATVKVVVFHCWLVPCGERARGGVLSILVLSLRDDARCRHRIWAMALASHLCYTPQVAARDQTRVKLNRVFFPR